MAKEYTKYQQGIIRRYYENREQIDFQRLSELVTNLYLSQGKKRAKFWETARDVMQRMQVPESRIKHVVNSDDPAILAELVNEMQAGKV